MSEKGKLRKKEYAAKQEKKAINVVNWIFGVLIGLAVLFMIYSIVLVS